MIIRICIIVWAYPHYGRAGNFPVSPFCWHGTHSRSHTKGHVHSVCQTVPVSSCFTHRGLARFFSRGWPDITRAGRLKTRFFGNALLSSCIRTTRSFVPATSPGTLPFPKVLSTLLAVSHQHPNILLLGEAHQHQKKIWLTIMVVEGRWVGWPAPSHGLRAWHLK